MTTVPAVPQIDREKVMTIKLELIRMDKEFPPCPHCGVRPDTYEGSYEDSLATLYEDYDNPTVNRAIAELDRDNR